MSYLIDGCGVSRMDGRCNECMYRRFGMSSRREGMSCKMRSGSGCVMVYPEMI